VGSFKNLLQNHWANFNQTWRKSSLGKLKGDSSLVNEEDNPSPRGDNSERVKIVNTLNFFLRSYSPEPASQN
jgi:hypothetical protein